MREGRKHMPTAIGQSLSTPQLAHLLPRVGSDHTAAYKNRDQVQQVSRPDRAARRKVRPFLDSMDGSKTASTSVVSSLTGLFMGLKQEPLLYDGIILPNIRSVAGGIGVIRSVRDILGPVAKWIKRSLLVLRRQKRDLLMILTELWKRTLPASMLARVQFTSEDAMPRFGQHAWPLDNDGMASVSSFSQAKRIDSSRMLRTLEGSTASLATAGSVADGEGDFLQCDEVAFMVRCLLPQVTVVLSPGCSDAMRSEVYRASNASGELSINVLHTYSTTACVDQIVVRGCRMRSAAWQHFLTMVDSSFLRWRRPLQSVCSGTIFQPAFGKSSLSAVHAGLVGARVTS